MHKRELERLRKKEEDARQKAIDDQLKEQEWIAKTKATITRWFTDPDTWVGCFSNHDLSSPDIGRKVAIPFKQSDGSLTASEVKKTKAPDTVQVGFGWRYILEIKAVTAEEVFKFYGI